jgi:hypothetical protein
MGFPWDLASCEIDWFVASILSNLTQNSGFGKPQKSELLQCNGNDHFSVHVPLHIHRYTFSWPLQPTRKAEKGVKSNPSTHIPYPPIMWVEAIK